MADGRTVTIGGKEYLVTAEMADAMDSQRKSWEEEKAKLSTKTVVPSSGQDDLDADKIFENPGAVLDRFGQKLTQSILGTLEEKEKKAKQAKDAEVQRDTFWADFAKAHPDLRDDGSLAKTVLFDNQSQFTKFADKNDDQSKKECIDLLADLTRKEIQKYIVRQKADSTQSTQSGHPFVEGATLRFGTPPPEAKANEPSSLTDILKNRAEARRKGKVA